MKGIWLLLCACLCALGARPVDNIEHIIIFMQENRPFDHYFGTLNGVRGYNDRTGTPMASGYSVFYQPTNQSNLSDYMLPFRVDPSKTNAMCMPAPEMWYPTDLKMWNYGRDDAWNTARDPGMGMSYFTRADLPYYYSLYDEFVVGDQYFQSTFTSTNPNRMHLFTGSNGVSVGEPAVIDNTEPNPGYDWITMGEILQQEGITWRVYQERNNFDDNAFAWFEVYMEAEPGNPLYDNGMARQQNLFTAFENDIKAGTLPQVSWIIAPSDKSEHATNHPCAGEDYTANLLNILWKYPDTYAKSVFVLDYDEGGQFYDHVWPPTPPMSEETGLSTVTVEGEINTDVLVDEPSPVGFGWRVPLLVVSPWTRGHIVVSEVFDHTSVIRLIEERFNIECPNISPWRRVVAGNLLSAFDFDHPNYTIPTDLPDTSDYVREGDVQCATLPPPVVPTVQSMPVQEPQTRISRALPYTFVVSDGIVSNGKGGVFVLNLENVGTQGAPFILYDVTRLTAVLPRQYAVEAGKILTDKISVASDAFASDKYEYTLLGPNGFLRDFQGQFSSTCDAFAATLSYLPMDSHVVITVSSTLSTAMQFNVSDNAYGYASSVISVSSENSQAVKYDVSSSGNWYDFTLTLISDPTCFSRRFMGRMETGVDSISDPAMAAGVPSYRDVRVPEGMHPPMPESVRNIRRVESPRAKRDKDAQFRFVAEEL